MIKVAVFDMNETTLNLSPVRDAIDGLIGHSKAFDLWFGRLLQISMAVSATGQYEDFSVLGATALDALAQAEDTGLPPDAWDEVVSAFGVMKPYPDVVDGLDQLRGDGWQLVALTNSAHRAISAQLAANDLTDRFDHVLSSDAIRIYKPAPAPYLYAAETVGTDPADIWMVACHDWDLAGAKAVGMSTAFVARPAMPFASVYPPADIVVGTFTELANRFSEMNNPEG